MFEKEAMTITVGELKRAREEHDAIVRSQGKVIVLVDGARLLSLPWSDKIVILVFREDERVAFARVVARVNGGPLPE